MLFSRVLWWTWSKRSHNWRQYCGRKTNSSPQHNSYMHCGAAKQQSILRLTADPTARTLTNNRTQRGSTTSHPASTQLQFIQLRTGLMLIAESGVKRRYDISCTLGRNVRSYGFVTLLTQLQSRVPSRTPAIFHKNMSNFRFDQVLVDVPPKLIYY